MDVLSPRLDLLPLLKRRLAQRLERVYAEAKATGNAPAIAAPPANCDEEEALRRLFVRVLPALERRQFRGGDSDDLLRLFGAVRAPAFGRDWRFIDAYSVFWERWPAGYLLEERRWFADEYAALLRSLLEESP